MKHVNNLLRKTPTSKPDICSPVEEIPFFEGSALQPFHNSPLPYAILSPLNHNQATPFRIRVLRLKLKVTVEFTLKEATKTQRESTGTPLLFL